MNRQAKVGLVVLSAIVLLYLVISWSKNSGLFARDYVRHQIFFKNVNGLKTSDPVTMYGYIIGDVDDISPNDSGMIVTVKINKDTRLFADASAKLLLKEIMGSKQVELLAGTSGTLLQNNALIIGQPTFDFTTAMDQIGQVFQNIQPKTIQQTIENLEKISSQIVTLTRPEEIDKIKSIIDRLQSALSRADRMLYEVEERRLIQKIDQITQNINHLTGEADKTLKGIQRMEAKADTLIPKISHLVTRTEQAIVHADALIEEVQSTMAELKTQKTMIGKLLYDTTFTVRMDTTLTNLDATLNHFRNKSINVKMVLKRLQ